HVDRLHRAAGTDVEVDGVLHAEGHSRVHDVHVAPSAAVVDRLDCFPQRYGAVIGGVVIGRGGHGDGRRGHSVFELFQPQGQTTRLSAFPTGGGGLQTSEPAHHGTPGREKGDQLGNG